MIGCGLIGGSVALRLKSRGVQISICEPMHSAWATLTARLEPWQLVEQVSELSLDTVDLIVLAAPPAVSRRLLPQLHAAVPVVDMGSVKAPIVAEATALGRDFTGGHPLRGSEQSGFDAANGDLFEKAPFFLCPAASATRSPALARELVATLGAQAIDVDPAQHDEAMARTSHLPHLVSALLVRAAMPMPGPDLMGQGMKDMSRLAKAEPELWQEILSENRPAVLDALRRFVGVTQQALQELEVGGEVSALTSAKRAFDESDVSRSQPVDLIRRE